MSTVYPLTTKYLKKGGSGDIDQLVEDVNELKQDVAGIEEVDETQNEDITNLKASDTAQNADLDKLRHQIVLMCCIYNSPKKQGYAYDGKIITPENDILDVSNVPALQIDIRASISSGKLRFTKRPDVNKCKNNFYYLYPAYNMNVSDYSNYGFGIFNGLGENVLANNKIIKAADVASGELYLNTIMTNYGTDYYKEHSSDTYNYNLLDANVVAITNIKQWMTDKLTSSDFDEMTNFNNWLNSKISAYDPTNSIKTDLTSTWTSSDYETMTNLKNWVESKAGGTTPTTTLKCPVDMYISTDGITDPQYSSHQVPFRISSASWKIGGSSCETSGYYISFHAELEGLNHITSMTILAIKQGQTFPTFSWDSLCKFYKADFSTSDANKYGGIYFIMSDGTVCFSSQIGRAAFILNEPKYVHFLTETIILDQLKNNVCKISNEEIEASTATYDTTRKPYYKFKGKEGSYRSYSDIEAITE